MRLKTALGEDLYAKLREPLRQCLRDIDASIGLPDSRRIEMIRERIRTAEQEHQDAQDEFFDDLYILRCWAEFLEQYGSLWRLIAERSFGDSWNKLQDALGLLRVIHRHSGFNVSGLENKLAELEELYPYKIFASVGMVVENFECSICGQDIDSFECPHRRGNLYRGRMAVGIAGNILHFDHVALVTEPRDRRCVVVYEETGEQFKLVRFLADLLQKRRLKISDFGMLLYKRQRLNPDYRRLRRNEKCFCGSGRKFKTCCMTRTHIEGEHVEITPKPLPAELAIE